MHLVIVDSKNKIVFLTNEIQELFSEVAKLPGNGSHTAAALTDTRCLDWKVGQIVDPSSLSFGWKV